MNQKHLRPKYYFIFRLQSFLVGAVESKYIARNRQLFERAHRRGAVPVLVTDTVPFHVEREAELWHALQDFLQRQIFRKALEYL